MSNIILSFDSVSKSFIQGAGTVHVLNKVSFEAKKGEIIAIIGVSGSGKSTLLQIAGLLDRQTSGEVHISEKDTKKIAESSKCNFRLNKIGFIYQYHHLLKDFNARENIAMPALIAGKDYEKSLILADQYLAKLGMKERAFNFPGQLSGGEQQRVAIARALFNNPELILADEPTGNLDPSTGEEVFDMFLELTRSKGTSTIIVTHNQSLAKKADKIYELKSGSLVQTS